MQSNQLDYLPILMQMLLAVGFVVGTIIISGKLGPKRNSKVKDENFDVNNIDLLIVKIFDKLKVRILYFDETTWYNIKYN